MKIKSSPKVPRSFGSLDRGGLILDFFNIEVIKELIKLLDDFKETLINEMAHFFSSNSRFINHSYG